MSVELDEMLAVLDIQSWMDEEGIRYRVTRGSRGIQLNVKECPCCGNSNWKVYVNAESGLGNCFHGDCEKKFNKWSFIKNSLGDLTYVEVLDRIKRIARDQGWRPPRTISVATNINTDLKLPESIALPHDGRNLKYLDNRNVTSEIARYFGLRYSHKGTFDYFDHEKKKRTQSYANRIIIPIFDLEGELVSFQGRDITGDADRKYLFPPGFASTGSVIYNGHNAFGCEEIVIGEGAFDVMAIKIAFDAQMELREVGVVGSFGKHLSFGDDASQLAKLMTLQARGLKRVTFMWDGEARAISDAVDAALLLNKHGFKTRVAILPKGKDPNEVAAGIVREAYWKAMSIDHMSATKIKLKHAA